MDNLFILVTALEHAVEAKVVLGAVAKGTGEVRGGRLGSLVALRVGGVWGGRGRGHGKVSRASVFGGGVQDFSAAELVHYVEGEV